MSDSSVVPETIEVEGRSYQVNELSFSDLQFRYATGRAIKRASDTGNKATGYRQGVMTRIGDLELSVWEMLIKDLIKRSGEEKLLLTMEGQGPDDVLFYFPGMRMLEYDTYTDDDYYYDCYEYDGSDVFHSNYNDYDWDLYEDEESLLGDQFLRPNTEENRDQITDWMMDSMEEALDYMGGF